MRVLKDQQGNLWKVLCPTVCALRVAEAWGYEMHYLPVEMLKTPK